jgi:hypothetical protein
MNIAARCANRGRVVIAAFAGAAFVWALVLSASPELHQRIHRDANRIDHSCAVTCIAAGKFSHSPVASLVAAPAPSYPFHRTLTLNSIWVQPIFLGAHVFANAPPIAA